MARQTWAFTLTFSSDTYATTTDADLTTVLSEQACFSGTLAGYSSGGDDNVSKAVLTDKLVFATDTTAQATDADLTGGVNRPTGLSDGSTNGYVAGGTTIPSGKTDRVDQLVFATDVMAVNTDATLPTDYDTGGATGLSDKTNGYWAGGLTGGGSTSDVTMQLVFASDTTAFKTDADLSEERRSPGAVSDGVA